MKKFSLLALLAGYVVVVSLLGVAGASPAVREIFEGQSAALLVAMLAGVYGAATALTVLIVTFLTTLSYRLAAPAAFEAGLVRGKVHQLLLLAFWCRVPALALQQFAHTPLGAALAIIPLTALAVVALRDENLPGARKLLAYLPFFLYLVADMVIVAMPPAVQV